MVGASVFAEETPSKNGVSCARDFYTLGGESGSQ